MQLPELITGRLIKRYKRFLADIELESGEMITAHCPNTGAMTGCAEPGSRVWLSLSDNPKRKYAYTWELVETAAGDMACIHSVKANALVKEGVEAGVVAELQHYDSLRTEVKFGAENSRADLLLSTDNDSCFVEVKSVTLCLDNGLGIFPDAVSDRGRKHLRELIAMKAQGCRAVLLFCVQHNGIERVAPADQIDPAYGETFREALVAGVEVLAYRGQVSSSEICLTEALPVIERQAIVV